MTRLGAVPTHKGSSSGRVSTPPNRKPGRVTAGLPTSSGCCAGTSDLQVTQANSDGSAPSGAPYDYWSDSQINVLLTPTSTAAGAYDLLVTAAYDENGMAFSANPADYPSPRSNPGPIEVTPPPPASLQVTLPPTPNPAAGGTTPTPIPLIMTNTESAFATATSPDLVILLMNSGSVTISLQNFGPATDINQVQWEVDRDPTDNYGPSVPVLPTLGTPSNGTITLTPNTPGNFRLVAYRGTGAFTEGEQVVVLRFAIVRATMQTTGNLYSVYAVRNNLAGSGISKSTVSSAPDRSAAHAAMGVIWVCLLEGGGSARTIGTTQISGGDIGNLIASDTFTVSYPVPIPAPPPPGNVAGTESENPGGPIPMLDALGVSGGAPPPFRVSTQAIQSGQLPAPPITGGFMVGWTSADSPTYTWDYSHPVTQNFWGMTMGSNQFTEYLALYTTSFPQTYLSVGQAQWIVSPSGTNGNASGWVCAQCSVSGNGANVPQGGKRSSPLKTRADHSRCTCPPSVQRAQWFTTHNQLGVSGDRHESTYNIS